MIICKLKENRNNQGYLTDGYPFIMQQEGIREKESPEMYRYYPDINGLRVRGRPDSSLFLEKILRVLPSSFAIQNRR